MTPASQIHPPNPEPNMTAITEHCDAQCRTCPIGCVDTEAEWSARAHPLPHPQPSHLRVVREPMPTQPFAPGVIEGPESKRGDIGLALMVAAAAAVFSGVWWWLG